MEWESTLLTDYSESIGAESIASIRVTYAGGMEIVLEAWHHTYQYWKNEPNQEDYQTWYVWGGCHGSDTDCETNIYLEMPSLGYTDIAIAAMPGNFYQESWDNPTMIENKYNNLAYCAQYAEDAENGLISEYRFVTQEYSAGYGPAQWTFDRKKTLWYWTNRKVSDIYGQISCLDHELSTSCCRVKQEINNTNSLSYATQYFFERIESSGDTSLSDRQDKASQYYTAIQNYVGTSNRSSTAET